MTPNRRKSITLSELTCRGVYYVNLVSIKNSSSAEVRVRSLVS